MYSADDLRPISALQHLLFCRRQVALIHSEQVWADNLYTAEGNHLHRNAHEGKPETRDGVRITRGLPLRNFRLGLVGQADVIQWQPPESQIRSGVSMARLLRDASALDRKAWKITPVEYKRGKPKRNDCDRVQLCAQALCLEEMLGVEVVTGDLFYGLKQRRIAVDFDSALRRTTARAAVDLHALLASGVTPKAERQKKCETCSLLSICLPAASDRGSAVAYLDGAISRHLGSAGPGDD